MAGVRRRKPEEPRKNKQVTETSVKTPAKSSLCWKCFLGLVLGFGLVAFIAVVGYVRAPFTAQSISDFSVAVDFEGPLEVNRRLTKGTKVDVVAPESIVEDEKGNLYTGLISNGKIVRIKPSQSGNIGAGEISEITSGIINDVPQAIKDANHGIPLGLRLVKNKLFVADTVYGLYTVDVDTKKINHIISVNDINPPLGFVDDLDITKDGKFIYFSDASSKYHLTNMIYMSLEGICDGRVLQYNTKTKEIRTVVSGMCFSNGVQLSEDESLLYVSETMKFRIRVIDLTSWKTSRFIDVPMMPDNVRPTGRGTYWIAGAGTYSPLVPIMEKNPILRQIVGGLFSQKSLIRQESIKHNVVVEINEDGDILQSLHDPDGELTFGISHATTLSDGRLAVGSWIAPHLGILDEKHVAIGRNKRS